MQKLLTPDTNYLTQRKPTPGTAYLPCCYHLKNIWQGQMLEMFYRTQAFLPGNEFHPWFYIIAGNFRDGFAFGSFYVKISESRRAARWTFTSKVYEQASRRFENLWDACFLRHLFFKSVWRIALKDCGLSMLALWVFTKARKSISTESQPARR